MTPTVEHLEGRKFYITIDGLEAHLVYSIQDPGVINFLHTYVPKELRGKGLALQLAKAGLDYAVQEGLKIIPSCSVVREYIASHPKDYQEYVL
jgi:predicted GNAT family acetyltransferase